VAQIAYSNAGTGASSSTTAALQPAFPATVAAGDIALLAVTYRDTTTTPSTPTGFTLLSGPDSYPPTPALRSWLYGKICDGTEDGTTVSLGTTGSAIEKAGRIYTFSGRVSGTITQLIRNIAWASHANRIQTFSITTETADDLGIMIGFQGDNNTAAAPTASGGTITEPVAEFAPVLTTGFMLEILTADPTTQPGTVSSTTTVGSANDPSGWWTFSIRPSPAATVKALGLVTQTQTVNAITRRKRRGIGLTTETEDANTVTPGDPGPITHSLGLITERERLWSLWPDDGPAIERYQAWPVTPSISGPPPIVHAMGLVSETEDANPITERKLRNIGLAATAEDANAFTRRKRRTIGLAATAEDANAITERKRRTLGLASTAEGALAVTERKLRSLGLASTAEDALAVTERKLRSLGLAATAEDANAFTRRKRRGLGLAAVAEDTNSFTRRKLRNLGLASAVEDALAISIPGGPILHALGLISEREMVQSATPNGVVLLSRISETEDLFPITPTRPSLTASLGLVTVAEDPFAITRRKIVRIAIPLGGGVVPLPGAPTSPGEHYVLSPLTAQQAGSNTVLLGLIIETESANDLAQRKVRGIGQATVLEDPNSVARRKLRSMGLATAAEDANGFTRRKIVFLSDVAELEEALLLGGGGEPPIVVMPLQGFIESVSTAVVFDSVNHTAVIVPISHMSDVDSHSADADVADNISVATMETFETDATLG
jgi:hypothetical protein